VRTPVAARCSMDRDRSRRPPHRPAPESGGPRPGVVDPWLLPRSRRETRDAASRPRESARTPGDREPPRSSRRRRRRIGRPRGRARSPPAPRIRRAPESTPASATPAAETQPRDTAHRPLRPLLRARGQPPWAVASRATPPGLPDLRRRRSRTQPRSRAAGRPIAEVRARTSAIATARCRSRSRARRRWPAAPAPARAASRAATRRSRRGSCTSSRRRARA
jgi:hypothetical protein